MPEPLWRLLARARGRGERPSPREHDSAVVEARMEALAQRLEWQVSRLEDDVAACDDDSGGDDA